MEEMSKEERAKAIRMTRLILLVPVVFGLIFAVIGVALGLKSWRTTSNLQQTEATVVEFSSNGDLQAPIVEFRANGRTYKATSGSFVNSSFSYSKGDKVDVYYDPQNPEDATVGSFGEMWGLPLGFVGMGFMGTTVFGWVFRRVGRLKRAEGSLDGKSKVE